MSINEIDLKGVNTYGYDWALDKYGCMKITLPNAVILVQKRPSYCDRGRFAFLVESTAREKVWIDFADAFPRYFFSLQRAFDELNDWVVFNREKLGLVKANV